MIKIEVVYVPENQPAICRILSIKKGSTVQDALQATDLYETYPETKGLSVGIFGKIVALETLIAEGDRVELYRPLLIDPMEKRRQRARKG